MTNAEIAVLAWGIGLLFAYGLIHLGGLELIRKIKPRRYRHSPVGLLLTFWGLAILHMFEIAVAAGMLAFLLGTPGYGSLGPEAPDAIADFLYFAGMSFATLGHSQLQADGAIRLLVMMLSLSGFMLITWSASFIYTIWGEIFLDRRN